MNDHEQPSARPLTITLGGRRSSSKAALIAELAAALDAPDWFGGNWDALAELLRERARPGGLTIDVRAANLVAPEDPSVLTTLTDIVDELASEGVDITLRDTPS